MGPRGSVPVPSVTTWSAREFLGVAAGLPVALISRLVDSWVEAFKEIVELDSWRSLVAAVEASGEGPSLVVRRSEEGGETWRPVLLPSSGTSVVTGLGVAKSRFLASKKVEARETEDPPSTGSSEVAVMS